MEADISNKTIVVLVVLTVVISVISTFLMMNEVNGINEAPRTTSPSALQNAAQNKNVAKGEVTITVLPKPAEKTATGFVTLTILPKDNKE